MTHLLSWYISIILCYHTPLAELRMSCAKLLLHASHLYPALKSETFIDISKRLKLHRGAAIENIFVSFIYSDHPTLCEYGSKGIALMCVGETKYMSLAIFSEMKVIYELHLYFHSWLLYSLHVHYLPWLMHIFVGKWATDQTSESLPWSAKYTRSCFVGHTKYECQKPEPETTL